MKIKYLFPILASIISILSIIATSMAIGWYLVLNGIIFFISLILQLMLIWKLYETNGKPKKYLLATLIIFVVFCLFREDFGDTSNSAISGMSVISKYLGLRDSAYYNAMTNIGSIINFLWYGLLVMQIVVLVKYRKRKKAQ